MRIVVVGGSVAGVAACRALRSEGWPDEIVLVSAEDSAYDRPPLSKGILLGTVQPADIQLTNAAELQSLRVDLQAPVTAHGLQLDRSMLSTDRGDMGFDGLIIATGSRARQPRFPAEGTHTLRTLGDALVLRDALRGARKAVIVGAGFIGLEVASVARELGVEVTVLEQGQQPMSRVFPAEVGTIFQRLHTRAGVEIRCGVEVVGIEGGAVFLAGGERIPGDVVLVGIGAVPNDGWLVGSGLAVRDGVLCDATLRAAPNVYAAGDVARWSHPLYGQIRIEHWTSARDHAGTAAANLVADLTGSDRPRKQAATIPYFWSDQLRMKVQMVGIPSPGDAVHHRRDGDRSLLLVGGSERGLAATIAFNWPREIAMSRRQLAAGRVDFEAAIASAPGSPAVAEPAPGR